MQKICTCPGYTLQYSPGSCRNCCSSSSQGNQKHQTTSPTVLQYNTQRDMAAAAPSCDSIGMHNQPNLTKPYCRPHKAAATSSSFSCTCICITNHFFSLTDTAASASAILLQSCSHLVLLESVHATLHATRHSCVASNFAPKAQTALENNHQHADVAAGQCSRGRSGCNWWC